MVDCRTDRAGADTGDCESGPSQERTAMTRSRRGIGERKRRKDCIRLDLGLVLLGRHLESRLVVEVRIWCRGVCKNPTKALATPKCVPREVRLKAALSYSKL